MAYLLPMIKNTYRKVVPQSIKQIPLVTKLVERLLGHDAVYDMDYYANDVEDPAVRSAGVIADSILLDLQPKTAVDVGCGTGALLKTLQERGCEVFGLEYSEAALEYSRARGLDVLKFDLERDIFKDDRTFDVAISMEVAEHLPQKIADRYVELLTRLSSIVVFTAAPPGQGGLDHVNEQPPSYWFSKFQARDFNHDGDLSERWRNSWKATGVMADWYYKNLMIFRRNQGT
ncbi:MAG: class I SAM-dependent methyltransferase [Chromatiales bacterium]